MRILIAFLKTHVVTTFWSFGETFPVFWGAGAAVPRTLAVQTSKLVGATQPAISNRRGLQINQTDNKFVLSSRQKSQLFPQKC